MCKNCILHLILYYLLRFTHHIKKLILNWLNVKMLVYFELKYIGLIEIAYDKTWTTADNVRDVLMHKC